MTTEKEWLVTFTVTGRATAYVSAADHNGALAKAKAHDLVDDGIDGELIEWEYDRPLKVEPSE